jgi:hypothetical protein
MRMAAGNSTVIQVIPTKPGASSMMRDANHIRAVPQHFSSVSIFHENTPLSIRIFDFNFLLYKENITGLMYVNL